MRSSSDPALVQAARSALLQRDGDIVDIDGISPVLFSGVAAGDYYIAIKHRNHLGVLSQTTVNSNNLADFTDPNFLTFGTAAQKNINGVQVLIAGEATSDGVVDASDRFEFWNGRNMSGYLLTDADLDGTCDASDRSIGWNNRNRGEQFS